MRLLLATANSGKIRELRAALAGLELDLVTVAEWGAVAEPEETGSSFAENARIKAAYYSLLTNLPALADDSGLEVDLLGGAPGVHSSRYADGDAERIARLLGELRRAEGGLEPAKRGARFVCALCLAEGGAARIEVEGEVRGRIAPAPRGEGGFGYDPIFYYPPLGKTFAEIPTQKKNRISHRARALAKLRLRLERSDSWTGWRTGKQGGRPLS